MDILIKASKVVVALVLIFFILLIIGSFMPHPEDKNVDIDPNNTIKKALWVTNANENQEQIKYTFVEEENTIVAQVADEGLAKDLRKTQWLNLWKKEEKPSQFVKVYIGMTQLLDVNFYIHYNDGSPIFQIVGDEVTFFEIFE